LARTIKNRSLWLSLGILLLLVLLPLFVIKFYTYLTGLILVTALVAMSLNLVVGYGGIYQFHHAVFYGVGAYCFGLIQAKTSLPTWVAFSAGPVLAAFAGLLIGWFCVRLTKLYFAMLQISLGSLVWAIAFRWYGLTGGDDGIHGIRVPEFLDSVRPCPNVRNN